MTNLDPGTQQCETHDNGSRSHAPAPVSSRVTSSSARTGTPQHASSTKAAPAARTFFDPWNSSSTGHQRAENRLSGSTSWRASRNLKLSEQYKGGLRGGSKRVADTVGAGSENFGKDGRKENGGWDRGASGLRTGGQKSLAELWGASKAGKKSPQEKDSELISPTPESDVASQHTHGHTEPVNDDLHDGSSRPPTKQIFTGLCFYINDSTAPLISDHRLKHLLAEHGARHSIALGRRSVTHVLLGTTNMHGGAGGGLAATKIQKEIARTGGKAVKFITAEWVLESIKAERRLPESRFSPLKLAPKSQSSVFSALHASGNGAKTRDQW
ncbi:hypothetical protein EK21DRAFT_70945 [Setomelanomma holmii]|uniref:BRCT domain-containing protein n=1 Tax=Setomelanomma holmii TaxID=210430 RepID=A0A9P4H489_9PLEO|nr:hypothetical protein EK21DRAFT_70945 [Setomelanomma holmii]